ncbi:MAG: hypothetical protein IKM04_06200 [Clostridia bacterium]|nr:hypothetical protein [Clostridia bacterium]
MEFLKNGNEYISSQIGLAIENGSRTAVISGNYEIAQTLLIPSNFTLILQNAHLRMADGTFCNMFVNENHGTAAGNTIDGTDRNISIIGRGQAVIDGGKYNGLSEMNQLQDGMPPIWKNNLILFTNVDGFKISGISCRNQRWWALNFIYCSNGYIGDIDFCSNDIGIDPDGNEYHGLIRNKYHEILVKNSDGIDLRKGCHDILIENISGFTQDDSVALTALDHSMENIFGVEGLPSDICNVTIRNIRTAAMCGIVRLLNQGGLKLHDVTVDGVYDCTEDSPYIDKCGFAVRIGDTRLYGSRHSTEDETYNITVKNVRGCGEYVLSLAGAINNLTLYGIEAAGGAKMLMDDRIKF